MLGAAWRQHGLVSAAWRQSAVLGAAWRQSAVLGTGAFHEQAAAAASKRARSAVRLRERGEPRAHRRLRIV